MVTQFNPLCPDSDQNQFSPKISSNCQEIQLRELTNDYQSEYLDLLLNSLNWFLKEMYGDQFGEFVCWYWDLKG